jgi:hypothetical protein
VEVLHDEKARTEIGFLRAIDDRQQPRLPLGRPRDRLSGLGVRHIRTRPDRPQTNGEQSASSARSLAAGPTRRYTVTPPREPRPYLAGWNSIAGADRRVLSAASCPEVGGPS